jgi:uncharacterized membrane protein
MKKIIPVILGIAMLFGATGHVTSPEMYAELIPSFIPEFAANLLATIAEAAIGLALIVPKFRKLGGLAFMALMIAFLPIHLWDMLKDEPFIGTKTVALIRLAIQFLMIFAGWWIYQKYKTEK